VLITKPVIDGMATNGILESLNSKVQLARRRKAMEYRNIDSFVDMILVKLRIEN